MSLIDLQLPFVEETYLFIQDLIFAIFSNVIEVFFKYEFNIYTSSGTYYAFMNPSIYDEDIEPFVDLVFNPNLHVLLMKTHTKYAANDIYFFSYFSFDFLIKWVSSIISNFSITTRFLFYFNFIFGFYLVLRANFIFFNITIKNFLSFNGSYFASLSNYYSLHFLLKKKLYMWC